MGFTQGDVHIMSHPRCDCHILCLLPGVTVTHYVASPRVTVTYYVSSPA